MIKEISRDEYQNFWLANQGTVFQDANWMECILKADEKALFYGKFKDNILNNVFPIVIRKGRVFTFLNQPLLTPFLGWVKEDDPKLIRQFVDKIKTTGSWYAVNRQVSDWENTITYQIDLTKDIEVLFNNLRQDKKRNIKKAISEGYKITFDSDFERLNNLVKMSLERQNYPHDDLSCIQNILSNYNKHFQLSVWNENTCLSSLLFVFDTNTVYYLVGGFDTHKRNYFAGPFAMWNGILKAKEIGISTFDFEGSIIPNIAEYFKSFGAEEKHYSYFCDYKWYFRIFRSLNLC